MSIKKDLKGKGDGVGRKRKELSIPKDIMVYEGELKPSFKWIDAPKKVNAVAANLVHRVLRKLVRMASVDLLDEILTVKLGKAPNKSQIVRHGHKMYNQGRQDERKFWKDRGYWITK